MSRLQSSALTDLPRRILASGVAALVLALTIFAASPTAHEWIHSEHDHVPVADLQGEHACAIVLFAGGVSLPLDAITVTGPLAFTLAISPETAADVDLVSPRYLRRPERGPPVA